MDDLPRRRDVHGVGRRGRLGDVSSGGPTGSLLRQRGSDGLVRAWGS